MRHPRARCAADVSRDGRTGGRGGVRRLWNRRGGSGGRCRLGGVASGAAQTESRPRRRVAAGLARLPLSSRRCASRAATRARSAADVRRRPRRAQERDDRQHERDEQPHGTAMSRRRLPYRVSRQLRAIRRVAPGAVNMRRSTLPTMVFGSSVRNSTLAGHLVRRQPLPAARAQLLGGRPRCRA